MILSHIRASFIAGFFPRIPEWGAACVVFGLGCMLSINDSLMSSSTGRGYALMLSIADQSTWASVLVVFGVARLAILFINGAWRRSPHLRAASAFLSCLLWTQLVLSFGAVAGFGFVMASGYLALEIINVFRAMRDARWVDDAYAQQQQGTGGGTK